ncbi:MULTISPECIES: hypothetical protein [Aliivibrio]|uniref:Uncharacterized protein n=1 Tax=Aliivibrio finisterrensis TaxID=511998 RepID=A0A4Q5KYR4_9GAMM|nr:MULTISPECIES: hypothetical protein [Aliivibrio]MDD9180724.1 hypothetical protein [Aliivibrio sp. A6]RYU49577.1 hypothetical protein ERW56_16725 [Aliivibrio finisterrensis]RYU53310.1 hypothetical protein ERW57_04060 [Aliivibrio finisterrensis]RYU53314.1 hypothetical protein ERW57_04085 [Aliivibrio finisterrensis]RYU55421.1 hypothetical protein ERW50_16570 [Aliivibrio finisterrensis]
MIEPNLTKIRLDLGLSKDVVFHGFLIHNTEKDDFLLTFTDNEILRNTSWTPMPDTAFRFKRFKKAFKAFQKLELEDRAIIVASFDIGTQILISSPTNI